MNDRATTPLELEDGVVWPEDAIEVGRIVDAWGVKGGFKVTPFSHDPQALFCTKKWFLLPAEPQQGAVKRPVAAKGGLAGAVAPTRLSAPRFLKVKTAREQGDVVVVTAEGLEDRNHAEALKGVRVFVSRSAFPTPDNDEFYWVDLIGLDVFNRDSCHLGKVVDLIDTGPHCVLRCDAGEAGERLIPFVSAYIDSVSLADKRIVADWGLDY